MSKSEPTGQLAIRTVAMPADSNPNGDIFGGWVVSHMDLAGMSMAAKIARGRVTTVAIESMVFLAPVSVGDFICCYAELLKIGRTSIRLKIETWAISAVDEARRQVTEGVFTFVAIDENGKPRPRPTRRVIMKKLFISLTMLCLVFGACMMSTIHATKPVQITSTEKVKSSNKKYFTVTLHIPKIKSNVSTDVDKHVNGLAKKLIYKIVKKYFSALGRGMAWHLEQKKQGKKLPLPLNKDSNALTITYKVFYNNHDFVSMRFDEVIRFYGAPHPNMESFTINYDLKNDKALKLADLFDPDSHYLKKISQYCREKLAVKLFGEGTVWSKDDPRFRTLNAGTGPRAFSFRNWNLTPEGLQITFDPYNVAAYVAGTHTVVIPYKVLLPMANHKGILMRIAGDA